MAKSYSEVCNEKKEKDYEKIEAIKNSGLRQDAFKDKEFQIEKHVNPEHYKECSLECIDIMCVMFGYKHTAEWCVQTAFKYIWRYKQKNGFEDLKKAEWYLNKFREIHEFLMGNTRVSSSEIVSEKYIEISKSLRLSIERRIEEYEKRIK